MRVACEILRVVASARHPPQTSGSPMNSDHSSSGSDSRGSRSEAGHRKLARWAVGLAVIVVVVAMGALFLRFLDC